MQRVRQWLRPSERAWSVTSNPPPAPAVQQESAPAPQPEADATDAPIHDQILDNAGNRIVGAIGRHGQYHALSFWDGKRIRVCGHKWDTEHLSYSEFDAGEGRFICRVCFPKAGDETDW